MWRKYGMPAVLYPLPKIVKISTRLYLQEGQVIADTSDRCIKEEINFGKILSHLNEKDT